MTETTDARAFCEGVLERAKSAGAMYADVRIVRRENESIFLRTGKVEGLGRDSSYGFGVRVIVDGAWGFSSSPKVEMAEGERIADDAVRIARAAAASRRKDVKLAPVDVCEAKVVSDFKIDPFDVPLEDKIALLRDADEVLRQNSKIKVTDCSMEFWKFEQVFASSEGAYIEQKKIESGGGIVATAIEGADVHERSYPSAFGGDYASAGYEFVESFDLVGHAEQTAREAEALLSAPPCPTGKHTLILEGSMLALQVHESCGHPIELDRVFGTESSYAGTSFLMPDKLNNFRYGSDLVNITADATIPNALGSFAFDDEGVPAQRVDIMKQGIFSGYLTSRETAAELALQVGNLEGSGSSLQASYPEGARSMGAMRADGWNRIPLIRMTNINLLPGDWTFDELIADTKDGIYAANVKSWSIDDKRLNFQFGTEIAWEIKDGALGRVLKNPIYNDMTPRFWGSCDAICNEDEWRAWGVPNCGKGEPGQSAHVGHGVAPSRFRDVPMEGVA